MPAPTRPDRRAQSPTVPQRRARRRQQFSHAVTYTRSTRLNAEAELTTHWLESPPTQLTDWPNVEPVLCVCVTWYPPRKPGAATVTRSPVRRYHLLSSLHAGVVAGEDGSKDRQLPPASSEETDLAPVSQWSLMFLWLHVKALPTPNSLLGASCKGYRRLKFWIGIRTCGHAELRTLFENSNFV